MVDSDLTLRIDHTNGDTSRLVVPTPTAIDDERVTLATIDIDRALDRVARCEAAVFRREWLVVESILDRRNDELYVENSDGIDIFGGRLDDWQYDGVLVSVQIDSFERDALDCEPPVQFERTAEPDDVIAGDMLAAVPDNSPVAAGTLERTTDSIDYDGEHHHSPGRMLRSHAEATGGEIEYHPDGTTDYLERRGEDRDEEISPSEGTIVSDPRIRETTREGVTHVRAYSQDDHSIYEEAEAIPTGPDEREVWDTAEIDSTSSSRIQAHATQRANEYANEPEYLELDATIDPDPLGRTPEVGDSYPVELPAYDISTRLRIIEANRTINDSGDLVSVKLSNRKLTLAGR